MWHRRGSGRRRPKFPRRPTQRRRAQRACRPYRRADPVRRAFGPSWVTPEWVMPGDAGGELTSGRSSTLPEDGIMSTGNRSDDELSRASLDEDMATRFTRGVVDGFTEASQAFSNELEGTNRFPKLMGRSVAGVLRANARLLDEVATVVREAADEMGERPRRSAEPGLDYERLADLVAARLSSAPPVPGAPEPGNTAPGRRKT